MGGNLVTFVAVIITSKKESMMYLRLIFPILFSALLFSCNDSTNVEEQTTNETSEYVPNEKEVAFEEYITKIDNDSLRSGNSLFFSKGNDKFTEVEFWINDKNEMVKLIEYYTQESLTIAKNIFYMKDGKKFASKELFEVNENGELGFIERVTYYDSNEQPIISKKRKAAYEQDLEMETFVASDKVNCKMDRALQILNQEGEFTTTFQGFVKESGFTYLIVGGPGEDAYTSTLVVQYQDQTTAKLMAKEKEMIGTPLAVDFVIVEDPGEGFEYQILRAVTIR